jgi:hypothetical protein
MRSILEHLTDPGTIGHGGRLVVADQRPVPGQLEDPGLAADRGEHRLAAHRGSGGLAVWANLHLRPLTAALNADLDSGTISKPDVVPRFLINLVDCSRLDLELTATTLDGVLAYTARHGAPTYGNRTDPRSWLPLPPLLASTLVDHGGWLRPGAADTPAQAVDLAATIVNMTMLRSDTPR